MTEIEIKPIEPDEAPAGMGRSSGLLIGGGVAASVIAHLTLGGVVLLASPRLLATVPEHSIMVDIVTPKEFEAASKGEQAQPAVGSSMNPAAEPQAKTEQKIEQKPEQKTEPKTEQRTSPPGPPPVVQQRPPPLASRPPQPAEQQKANEQAQEARPPEKQAMAEEAVPDPATIVEMLHLPVQIGSAGSEAPPSENAAKLSSDEIAEFKEHLKKCWVPPAGVPDVKKLKAVIRVSLSPDGQLMGKPALLAASASLSGPALVESAMRALAQCQPYTVLPAQKYKEWKLLDLNFSQDDILDVSSSQNGGKTGPKG
jgi:hypothetical protein